MLNTIKTNVLVPLWQRLGTSVATVLIGYGIQADISHATGAFVGAGAGLVFDLVQDYLRIRAAKAGR